MLQSVTRRLQILFGPCWKNLLQSVTNRNFHDFQINYYKVWQNWLYSVTGITKCDKIYYKVWQVLQSVTIITKWDVTPFMTVIIRSNYDFQSNG